MASAQMVRPPPTLSVDELLEIASYLNDAEDLLEFASTNKFMYELLHKDVGHRARLFVKRHGAPGACVRLWLAMVGSLQQEPGQNYASFFYRERHNVELALAVLRRPDVQRLVAHNILVDLVQAGVGHFLRSPTTRERVNEWLLLLPLGVTLLDTRTVIRPLQSIGERDREVLSEAVATGFRAGLPMIPPTRQGHLKTSVVMLNKFLDETDDNFDFGETLRLVAPPSIVHWDMIQFAKKASLNDLAALFDHYETELQTSPRAILHSIRFLNRLDEEIPSWIDDPARLEAIEPLCPYWEMEEQDLVAQLHQEIARSKIVDYQFDPLPFLCIVESGSINLDKHLAKLQDIIEPFMDPAVLHALIKLMAERDRGAELTSIVHKISREVATEYASICAENKWRRQIWFPREFAKTNDEERFRRAYFNTGLLVRLLCRLDSSFRMPLWVPPEWVDPY